METHVRRPADRRVAPVAAFVALTALWLAWSAWLVSAINYGWRGGEGALDGSGWALVLMTFVAAPAVIIRVTHALWRSRPATIAVAGVAGVIGLLGFAVTALP